MASDDSTGNGPWWIQVLSRFGIWAFVVLYGIGVFDGVGLKSPVTRLLEADDAHVKVMKDHDEAMRVASTALMQTQYELLRLARLTCYGVWKDRQDVARTCGPDPAPAAAVR